MVDLLKIPAVNPDGGGAGEYKRALFVNAWLTENGFKVERFDFPDTRVPEGVRVNLVTRLEGIDKSRTLWFVAHLDTVPEGHLKELWTTDPYVPTIKEGKIYGRGSEDSGQAIISILHLLKVLKDLNIKPNVNVGAAIVSDGDGFYLGKACSRFGVIPLLKKGIFKKTDLCLAADAGDPEGALIEVAEKSILWLQLVTIGKTSHGSTPQNAINASRVGMKLALRLDEHLHRKYDQANSLFDPPNSTFEPTVHENTIKNPNVVNDINVIPNRDFQYLDCRILPVYTLGDVMQDVKSIISEIQQETHTRIEVSTLLWEANTSTTSPDGELVLKLKTALRELRNIDAKTVGVGGGTIGSYFRQYGIETVVWSTLEIVHGRLLANEYSKIDNMVNDSKIFLQLALK